MLMLQWLRPAWLWALLPLLGLLCLLCRQRNHGSRAWEQVCDPHLLKHLRLSGGQGREHLIGLFLAIGWLVAVLALAGPSVQRLQPLVHGQTATIIALDLSASMRVTDLAPSRWQRAIYKIQDCLRGLEDQQVGLLAFGPYAFPLVPVTSDLHTIRHILTEVSPEIMPAEGANLADALRLAKKLLLQAESPTGQVLVFTGHAADAESILEAKKLRSEGIRVSILGVGSEQAAPLVDAKGKFIHDGKGLRTSRLTLADIQPLARAGGGLAWMFRGDNQKIEQWLHWLQEDDVQKSALQHAWQWWDGGWLLVLLILPLLLLALRPGLWDRE
jgi:Ca-activated chloride channel homolog